MTIKNTICVIFLLIAIAFIVYPKQVNQQEVHVDSVIVPSKPIIQDDRADYIDAYFIKHKMPLAGYGKKFVEEADKNNIDYRLLPAISVKEQSGGRVMPYNCPNSTINYNVFGWASAKICFKSFNEAIEVVARNLGGNNPRTHSYYKGTTYQKLWSYNGTVEPTYPDKVIAIMKAIGTTK